MNGHLVAIEVSVKSRTHERVHLYGATLDQHRLERLNAQPVQCRCAVQKDRAIRHDLPDSPRGLGATWRQILVVMKRQEIEPEYEFAPVLPA